MPKIEITGIIILCTVNNLCLTQNIMFYMTNKVLIYTSKVINSNPAINRVFY